MHPTGSRHDHDVPQERWRLLVSVVLNFAITVAEVVGGLLSGSLALLSDALHNFGDTMSLAVSYFARRYSDRGANLRKTFGYKRLEVVAAFFNLVVLALISLFLVKEGIDRALEPRPIRGGLMLAVACIGLGANVATALLLRRQSKESLNIRSAYLHIVTDAASSVGVVLGALVILRFDFVLIDPILTVAIAGFILYQVYHLLRDTTNILMNSAPPDVDVERVVREMGKVPLVRDVHHVHVWSLDEHTIALEAHIVIDGEDATSMNEVKSEVKSILEVRFGISHSTLEFEFEQCTPASDCV